MTLWLYVLRRFVVAVLQVQLVVLFLVLLFTGVENIRSLSRYDASGADIAQLTLLQSPAIVAQAFPLVLMLGALSAFLGLSRSSELVVIRASSVSAIRVLHLPVLVSIGLGFFGIFVFNPIVSTTSERADVMEDDFRLGGRSVLSFSNNEIWLRQGSEGGQTVIQADRVSANGVVLYGVRLHDYDPDGQLVARINAASASLLNQEWALRDVKRWPLDTLSTQALEPPQLSREYRIPTDLTPDKILDSFAPPDRVSVWELPEFIRQLEAAGFSAIRHRLYLQVEFARPALFAAMVLIGAGFSMRHVRFGQTGVMILMAVLAGFALYFFKDVAESLGASGAIPITLAAWSPPAAAIMLATALLLHLEDG